MRAIWKYTLVAPRSIVSAPPGRVIQVHEQEGLVCVWIEADLTSLEHAKGADVVRTFRALNTGDEVPDGLSYCGTAHVDEIVWHVYEEVGGDG